MVSGDLGMRWVTSQHNNPRGTSSAQVLPGTLISLPLLSGSPSPSGLLTQGSIQILEDTATVVQGDIDPLLQERGHQAAAGTGPGRGQGSITQCGESVLPLLPLPFPTPTDVPCHIRAAGSPGKASQWPSPWDLLV